MLLVSLLPLSPALLHTLKSILHAAARIIILRGKSDHISTCSTFHCLSSHLDTTQTPYCDLTGNKTWLLPSPPLHPPPHHHHSALLQSLSLFYVPQTPKLICHLLFVLLEPSSPFTCQVPSGHPGVSAIAPFSERPFLTQKCKETPHLPPVLFS